MKWTQFLERNRREVAEHYIDYASLKSNVLRMTSTYHEAELISLRDATVDTLCEQSKDTESHFVCRLEDVRGGVSDLVDAYEQATKEQDGISVSKMEELYRRMRKARGELARLKLFGEMNATSIRKIIKKMNAALTLHSLASYTVDSRVVEQRVGTLEFQTLESLAPVSDMLTPVWTKMERLFQRVRGNACRARNASAAWFLLFGFFGLFLVYLFTEEMSFSSACLHGLILLVSHLFMTGQLVVAQFVKSVFSVTRYFTALFAFRSREYHPSDVEIATLVEYLPLNFFSKLWGTVHSVKLPMWARVPLYRFWSVTFGCNLDEIRYPLESYANLAEFFSRPLREGARNISDSMLVSPCDCRVVSCGEMEGNTLHQVKGLKYSVDRFLGLSKDFVYRTPKGKDEDVEEDPILLSKNMSLEDVDVCDRLLGPLSETHSIFECVLYLAPGDYHRIHSPCDWLVHRRRHFPGSLLPVSLPFVSMVPHVFSVNERVALCGDWEHGFFSLTAVGAYNVGSIVLSFDKEVQTNHSWLHAGRELEQPYGRGTSYEREYPSGISLEKGEDIAHFRLGSTIVLVFAAPKEFRFACQPGQKVFVGDVLGDV